MPTRFIFYDTETTGINSNKDCIIEIAAFDPATQQSFQQLINPGIPIPKEAMAIHNITDEMVADAPSFKEVAIQFVNFCAGDIVLVAHNNDSFDEQFLRNEFTKHQVELPSWKFLDSLKWARKYRPDLPRHSLQFLREAYGIQANNAHRALDDVIVLHQVFSFMTDDLDPDQILNLIKKPREMLHMPFGKYQGKPLNSLPSDYIRWLTGSGALEKQENQELRASFEKLGLLQVS